VCIAVSYVRSSKVTRSLWNNKKPFGPVVPALIFPQPRHVHSSQTLIYAPPTIPLIPFLSMGNRERGLAAETILRSL
jgi:hypothetical protein